MRRRGNGKAVKEALFYLERNYDLLWSQSYHAGPCVGFFDAEDIFQETVMMITVDRRCQTITSDEDFREYFRYRMRMVRFQTIKDHNNEEKQNADYQQAKENSEEEDWR